MKNKKPQTIADLKINWIFDNECKNVHQLESEFLKLNSTLAEYEVIQNKYQFLIKNQKLISYAGIHHPLSNFIAWLHYQIWWHDFKFPVKLLKFELIKENTFKIHTEEVKE